jgi:hypothetical protein
VKSLTEDLDGISQNWPFIEKAQLKRFRGFSRTEMAKEFSATLQHLGLINGRNVIWLTEAI